MFISVELFTFIPNLFLIMKKTYYLFALWTLLATLYSCREESSTEQHHSIVGTWKPIKEVVTRVDLQNTATSELFTLDDCQQSTRYTFNADLSGRLIKKSKRNDLCEQDFDTSFNYQYHNDGKFNMQSIHTEFQQGDISFHDANTMNLKLITQNDETKVITTTVTTLHRVE